MFVIFISINIFTSSLAYSTSESIQIIRDIATAELITQNLLLQKAYFLFCKTVVQ